MNKSTSIATAVSSPNDGAKKKSSASKKGINVTSELLNVRGYSNPSAVSTRTSHTTSPRQSTSSYYTGASSSHSSRRHGQPALPKSVATAQFLQANFKFIMIPFCNQLSECFFDPDILVPWTDVACVVVTRLSGSTSTTTCPICLDDIKLPKITKCGHTFCYPCILRHLEGESVKNNTCPMCACEICHSDLRPVRFHTQVLPVETRDFTFKLLHIPKGSLFPAISNDAQSNDASQLVPLEGSPEGYYARITVATIATMQQLFAEEQQALEDYRAACLQSTICDISPVTYKIIEKSQPQLLPSSDEAVTVTVNKWTAQKGVELFAPASASARTSGSYLMTEFEDSAGQADVEYLPFVEMGMEHLNQRRIAFETSCSSRNKSSIHSSIHSTRNNNNSNNESQSSTEYKIYQATNGDLIYLHPLCMKCLLTASQSQHQHQHGHENVHENEPEHNSVILSPPSLPNQITGRVVEIERLRVTRELRQRMPFVRHLPESCDVLFVEIDLESGGLVSTEILQKFKKEFSQRQQKRKEMQMLHKKENQRDAKERAREQQRIANVRREYELAEQLRKAEIDSLMTGPTAQGTTVPEESTATQHENDDVIKTSAKATTLQTPTPNWSFKRIAEMGGHFPTLDELQHPSSSTAAFTAATSSPRKAKLSSSLLSIATTVTTSSKSSTTTVPTSRPPQQTADSAGTWQRGIALPSPTPVAAVIKNNNHKKTGHLVLQSNTSNRSLR